MLLAAELLGPNFLDQFRERGYLGEEGCVKCDWCKITYTDDEYKVLYDNHKLGYFYFSYEGSQGLYQLCHDCLFKKIKKISEDTKVDLYIYDDKKSYHCKFYPEDEASEDWKDSGDYWKPDDDDELPDFLK